MKMVLDVVRSERGMDFGSIEMEPMLDEGAAHGQPTNWFGTVRKTVRIGCWTKMVHEKLFACYCLVVE